MARRPQQPRSVRRNESGRTSHNNSYRAKIRMYRHGLGDCFLVTLPRTSADGTGDAYYIMIDCGVILGTPDAAKRMTEVVDDIARTTKGKIDLLVVTHEHWDHVSGFAQAKDSFSKLEVGELWLAWTEDPEDMTATKIRQERDNALTALRLAASQHQFAGDAQTADEIESVLGFFGAAKGASTKDALENAKSLAPKTSFREPGEAPVHLAAPGVDVYVLGPPKDEKWLRKINPSTRDKETYGLALGALDLYLDGPASALRRDGEDTGRPFHPIFEIPLAVAEQMEFFKERYWRPGTTDEDWRRIDTAWLIGSTELALQLDSLTNNTSLALAIELADGDVLLFAADAQVGNWLSWHELEWTEGGKKVTGPDLIRKTIFYKVGHHASHNATLQEKGLELMDNLRVAMIPVDEQMAKKKRWNHMPLPQLLEALEQRASGAVIRADMPLPKTKERFAEQELYHELTI